MESPAFDFVETDYYEPTMGPGIKKIFWAFEKPFDAADLVEYQTGGQSLGRRIRRRGETARAEAAEHRPGLSHFGKTRAGLDQGFHASHLSESRHLRRSHAVLQTSPLAASRLHLRRLPPRRLSAVFQPMPGDVASEIERINENRFSLACLRYCWESDWESPSARFASPPRRGKDLPALNPAAGSNAESSAGHARPKSRRRSSWNTISARSISKNPASTNSRSPIEGMPC